jgi:hypothetical protein
MHKFLTDEENIAAYCTPGPKPKKRILQQAAYVKWNKIKPNGFAVGGEGPKTKTGITDRSAIYYRILCAEQPAPISIAATRDSLFSITQSPIGRASKAGGPLYRGMVVSGDEVSKQNVGILAVSQYHQLDRVLLTSDVLTCDDHDFPKGPG